MRKLVMFNTRKTTKAMKKNFGSFGIFGLLKCFNSCLNVQNWFVRESKVEITNDKYRNMHRVVPSQVLQEIDPSGDSFNLGRGPPIEMKVDIMEVFVIIYDVSF